HRRVIPRKRHPRTRLHRRLEPPAVALAGWRRCNARRGALRLDPPNDPKSPASPTPDLYPSSASIQASLAASAKAPVSPDEMQKACVVEREAGIDPVEGKPWVRQKTQWT